MSTPSATVTISHEDLIIGHEVQFSAPAVDAHGRPHPSGRHELIIGTVLALRYSGVDILITSADPTAEDGYGTDGEVITFQLADIGGLIDITALEGQ